MSWQIFTHPTLWKEVGLVVFLVCFVGIVIWALTRTHGEIRHWSALPLEDSADAIPAGHDPGLSHESAPEEVSS